MKKNPFQKFCDKAVSLDPAIRFVGIADGDGNLMATAERKNLKPIMNPEERAQYAITAATRQYTRLRWEYLLGKINYACSFYAKLIRATIPVSDENGRLAYVVLMSFDVKYGDKVHGIILKKTLPLLKRSKAGFKHA